MSASETETLPPQVQDRQPGLETEMEPRPAFAPLHPGSDRLKGKVALITGGDSGIGRAVAVVCQEGADVVIVYLDEHEDAKETKRLVEKEGRSALLSPATSATKASAARRRKPSTRFGHLDVLVNNAAEQHPQDDIGESRGAA